MDQASKLREMAEGRAGPAIAVISGKGGVGKTNISLSLGLLACRNYSKVLLWDGDFGLANCDVLLDLASEYSIVELLRGEVGLEEAVVNGPRGLKVLPASSGVREPVELDQVMQNRLRALFDKVKRDFEMVIVDSAAGIGENVIRLALWADMVLLVTTPEVPAVADAYATLKALYQAGSSGRTKLIVNMAGNVTEAQRIGGRIQHVAKRFLGVDLPVIGWVPLDSNVVRAVSTRKPFVLSSPNSPAARSLESIWEKLSPPLPLISGGSA